MPKANRRGQVGGQDRRRVIPTAGALALAVSALGAWLVTSAAPAYADVGTSTYTIGTPTDAVGSVMASPSTVVQSGPTSFEVRFKATAALSGADAGTITIASSVSLTSAPSNVAAIDDSGTACFQTGTNGGGVSTSGLTVDLGASCNLNAGAEVEVDFTAGSPVEAGEFDFTVTTSGNATPAVSNAIIVSGTPPTLSVSSTALGANANYTITDASWTASTLSEDFTALVLTAKATSGTTVYWYGAATGYSVTYTPPAGAAMADPVTAATVATTANAGDTVSLTLATPLAAGDSLSVTGRGTNPATASTDEVSLDPQVGPPGSATSVGSTETSSNTVLFGTSVAGVTLVASPPVAGATATYAISFQATTTLPGGPGAEICLSEAAGPTLFSSEIGELVTDTTAGWHFVAGTTTYPAGSPPANPGCGAADNGAVIALAAAYDIRAGDYVTLTLAHVTNPPAATVSDFSLSTSSDTVPAFAPPYLIGDSASPGVVVTVSPPSTGSLATYTISNLVASAAMTGGSSTITIEGPASTVFPNNAGYYTVEDSTTPSRSGTVGTLVAGGGTNDVVLTVPESINAGDDLSLTVEDAINPSSASSSYSITLLGSVAGPLTTAPFPHAGLSYPNGAIVSFFGYEYVFAGGHAFEVGAGDLAALEKVDHAEEQTAPAGTSPPGGAPRAGTLLFTRPVDGNATIYVAGTDGDLHGFATPAQLTGDGYDPALVVTVPSVSGLTVGAPAGQYGAGANALSTSADGAIIVSSSAYYVFAGGRAFGIPTPSALVRVKKEDKAKVLSGTVNAAQTSARVANGVLLSASGLVYVSYQGELWPFKSEPQLVSDGYAGTAAVPVPGSGGVALASAYSGL